MSAVATFSIHIDELDEALWELDRERLILFFADWMQLLLIGFKRGDFREEKEWRLVYRTWGGLAEPKNFEFRTWPSGLLVPFCVLRPVEGLLPIKGIRVGPSTLPDLAASSLRGMLRKWNYANVIVDHCDIPLREL